MMVENQKRKRIDMNDCKIRTKHWEKKCRKSRKLWTEKGL